MYVITVGCRYRQTERRQTTAIPRYTRTCMCFAR